MDSTVVMEIENGVSKSAENIKNIAKVHHVKYLNENGKLFYHVWQYYGIGKGKKFPVGPLPIASNYTVSGNGSLFLYICPVRYIFMVCHQYFKWHILISINK